MKNKILLMFFVFCIACPIVFGQDYAIETKNNFSVEWYHVEKGLTKDVWVISVQNLNLEKKDFDLNVLVNAKRYNANNIKITKLEEWKEVEVPVYTLSKPLNDCEVEKYKNGTVCLRTKHNWIETKTKKLMWTDAKSRLIQEKSEDILKESYGLMNIPKLDSKPKEGTVNGTKYFRLTYEKQIQHLGSKGYGSSFELMLENEGETYHPHVLSGYNFKKTVYVTTNATKDNVNSTINITFDYADIYTGNLTKEIRFVAENASNNGIEIGWNLLGNYTDGEGGGSALVMITLRGSAYNYSYYYGNVSGTQSPEYGKGMEKHPDGNTVALYHFNNNYEDASANAYHADGVGTILANKTACQAGLPDGLDGCVRLDSSSDFVNMTTSPDNADWDLGASGKSFTISMYAHVISINDNCYLFSRWYHTATERTYLIASDDADVDNMRLAVSPDGSSTTNSDGSVLGNSFVKHIAAVFDNGNDVLKMFYDGKQGGSDQAFASNVKTSDRAPAIVGDDPDAQDSCSNVRVDEVWITTEAKTDWSGAIAYSITAKETSNTAPNAPLLKAPSSGQTISDTSPKFEWYNSTDGEGDSLTYDLYLYNDSLQTQIAYSNGSITEQGDNQTNLTLPSDLLDGTYYWKVIANDGSTNSSFSENFTFTIATKPSTSTPGFTYVNSATLNNLSDLNISTVVTDPSADPTTVDFIIFVNDIELANFSFINVANGTNISVIFNHLNYSKGDEILASTYADDGVDIGVTSNTTDTVINSAPTTPLIGPATNQTVAGHYFDLSCWGSTDIDNDTLNYEFWVGNNTNPPDINVQNSTLTNYSYLSHSSNMFHWFCRASDQTGEISDNSSTYNFTLESRYQTSESLGFPLTAFESSTETFTANLTYNQWWFNDVDITLLYGGTNYTGTLISSTNGSVNYDFDIVVPEVTDPTNYTFNWTYSFIYYNSTSVDNITKTYQHQVSDTGITNCSVGNDTVEIIATWDIKDELNDSRLLGDIEGTVDIWLNDRNAASQIPINILNKTGFNLCARPKGQFWNADIDLRYNAIAYSPRFQYLRQEQLNATIVPNRTLYMLLNEVDTLITFEILDDDDSPLASHYMELYRKKFINDTWFRVAVGETDSDGLTSTYLELNDATYQARVYDDNVLLQTFELGSITSTDIRTLRVAEDTIGETLELIEGVNGSLTFNNETKTFSATWTTQSGSLDEGCLKVIRYDVTGDEVGAIYDQCSASDSDTLSFTIPHNESQYSATFYGKVKGTQKVLDTLVVDLSQSFANLLGMNGVFIAFIIIFTMALVGIWSPAVSVGFSLLGLIIAFSLGVISAGIGFVMGVIVVGIMFIIKLRA